MKKFAKSNLTNEVLNIIRTYAYNNNVSMSEIGRRAGISKAWLSRLKNTNSNLSLETAEHILDVLGYKIEIKKK